MGGRDGGLARAGAAPAAAPLAGLLAQRFCLVSALAIVFDIRDFSRDRLTSLRTMPVVLGLRGAKAVALALLAASVAIGLGRGAPPLVVLVPSALAAWVISVARDTRGDYFFALVADGVLLVQAAVALAF